MLCGNINGRNPKIVGLWKLVSYQYGENQPEVKVEDYTIAGLKIFTKTHFNVVSYQKKDLNVETVLGGTYSLQGNIYVENIEYDNMKITKKDLDSNLPKSRSMYSISFKKNKMYISGVLFDEKAKIRETWEKVE